MKSLLFLLLAILCGAVPLCAQEGGQPLTDPQGELPRVFDEAETARLIKSVDRGLRALKGFQEPDGSFQSRNFAKPAVTSLAIMAYLSRGHLPGEGPYGEVIDKGIEYVLTHQQPSGLFSVSEIEVSKLNVIPERGLEFDVMAAKTYNHAICMLMLGEVYGLTKNDRAFRIRDAIDKGLKFTIQLWDIRKPAAKDDGGFRYTRLWEDRAEGDVSITGWHTASMRSIRNAGFDVPQSMMDRIGAYLIRTQNKDGSFGYINGSSGTNVMTAAGTLCMTLAGKYDHPGVEKAATRLIKFRVNDRRAFHDNARRSWPYYTCYYVTQASIQLGGRVWSSCMRQCGTYLLNTQSADGTWPRQGTAREYGHAYSTSMAIISLTPILQILPIYQR